MWEFDLCVCLLCAQYSTCVLLYLYEYGTYMFFVILPYVVDINLFALIPAVGREW